MNIHRKPDVLHQRLARRSQRHAAQRRPVEAERRIATLEALLHITQERMVADSLLLGTDSTHLPEPGEITAQTRRSDEAACAALAELTWTPAERVAFHGMRADADGER